MAEELEACAAVGLSFEHFRFGVDAFGSSIVVCQGECGGDGGEVLIKSAGEGMHVGQVHSAGTGDPLP